MTNNYPLPADTQPISGVVAQTNVSYLVAGSGPPVVLLHGLGAVKEIWWNTLRALAPSFRAWAFDWPQQGRWAEDAAAGLDKLAELAAASCAALGLEQIVLIGHSLGGNVAARLALSHPELVQRLVLVDAALDTAYISRRASWYAHPRYGEAMWHLNRRLVQPLARLGRRVPHEHAGGMLQPLARRMHYAVKIDPQTLYDYMRALWHGSLGERLGAITQPTLIMTGSRDPLVSPRQARHAAQTIPHATLCVLPGAYHNPMDERPALFNQALLRFLLPPSL